MGFFSIHTLAERMFPKFRILNLVFSFALTGCALWPNWHWEKNGASESEYQADLTFCKSQTDQSLNGTVTNESVRRLHACMERRGWQKVKNTHS